MRFSSPFLLLLLLVLPVLWALGVRAERYLARVMASFTLAGEGAPSWRRRARLVLPLVAMGWLIIALAGPAVEVAAREETTYQASLVIGLDVSKSMLAEDVLLAGLPGEAAEISNRLNLARRFLRQFLGELKNENAGLLFFAGSGLEIVPLTRDHGFFRFILRHADVMEMTDSGSDLGDALRAALGMLEDADPAGVRTVILISDGEDTAGDAAGIREALAAFSDQGIRVFTVGVGEDQPVYIPARKPGIDDFDDFYRDRAGGYQQTRLEEGLLKSIAAETRGSYVRLDEGRLPEIAAALRSEIYRLPAPTLKAEATHRRWLDLSPGALLLALLSYGLFLLV